MQIFSSQSQTHKLQVKKRGKCSNIQNETVLYITSLATASFVLDVNRLFDDVTDILPRMHMPIFSDKRKRHFSA